MLSSLQHLGDIMDLHVPTRDALMDTTNFQVSPECAAVQQPN